MSPKKGNEEKEDLQKKMKQEIKQKAQIESKKMERVRKGGEKEEKKTGEDSFCLNLKPELR